MEINLVVNNGFLSLHSRCKNGIANQQFLRKNEVRYPKSWMACERRGSITYEIVLLPSG
jgi:hypothetical protein